MNIVIINADSWRADHAGCYGHPVVRTPHLDRLAAAGTRFEQCHVQHTVCSPSRCSFMTGWYPHVRGHRNLDHLLQPEEPHLLRSLHEAGWQTAWFGKNDCLAAACFDRDIDYHDDNPGFLPTVIRNAFADPQEPGFYSFLYEPTPGGIDDHVDAHKVAAGIDFLRHGRDPDRPFCLYLPLAVPHGPFSAPQPYHDLYDPDSLPPLRGPGTDRPELYRLVRELRGLDRCDPAVLRRVDAVYCGLITLVDELVGRVLDTLEELGLAATTTVLVHSDHGEWAGDYGCVEKWSSALDDCLTRVPLVVRTPGGARGHVVREPVELQDQMATVLELCGIEAAHTHFARSLVPQLHGAAGDPERAVFAEGGRDLHEPQAFEVDFRDAAWRSDPWRGDERNVYFPKMLQQAEHPLSDARSVMIRTGTHKLIRRPATGEHELYDLQADPQELHNRHDDPALGPVQADLQQRLCDWLIHTSDVVPIQRDPRGMPERSRYWRRLPLDPPG
ncbi:MAG: sulfatase-like hydrolase/transferase [Planctomycetota bacterium]